MSFGSKISLGDISEGEDKRSMRLRNWQVYKRDKDNQGGKYL